MRRTWARGRNDEFLGRALKYAQRRRWAALLKAFHAAVAKVGTARSQPVHVAGVDRPLLIALLHEAPLLLA